MKDEKIYCPVCGGELKVTHKDHYEDIQEHASGYNYLPSLKDGYQCLNEKCVASEYGITWLYNGDMFIVTKFIPEDVTYSMVSKRVNELCNHNIYAINSWSYYYELGTIAVKKRTIKLRIGNLKIDIIPKKYGYKYPDNKNYMPRLIGWKVEFWKQVDENSYTRYYTFYHNVKYSLYTFTDVVERTKRVEKISGMKNDIKNAYCVMMSKDHWQKPDNKKSSKFAAWIINTFYKKSAKHILQLATELNVIK